MNFKNITKFLKDTKAQAEMSTMDIVIATAIGLLVLVAVFQMAPMLGNSIDEATELGYDVAATGTFTLTGASSHGETVTVGTITYQLSEGDHNPANVGVLVVDLSAPSVTAALTTAFGNNATTAAVVTATNPTTTTILLTASAEGADGNSVVTTSGLMEGTFGAATLTGGQTDVSDWNTEDVPTGVDVWQENASLLLLVVLVSLLGLAILIIRGLQ